MTEIYLHIVARMATDTHAQLEQQAGQLSEKLRAERDECDSLRRDVERSITVERSEELEARCTSLEGQVMKLKVECEKQKAVADIASRQAATIQAFTKSDKEVWMISCAHRKCS